MPKKNRIQFQCKPRSQGGDSYLKLVTFDTDDKTFPPYYGFGGVVKNGIPQLWEDAEKVERFSLWTEQNELKWLIEKWQVVSQSPLMARGYIADSDYSGEGTGTIYQKFNKAVAKEKQQFRYMIKVKLANEQYERWRTIGMVDENTGELNDSRKACLGDLQGRYNAWRFRHPELIKGITVAIVLGDGQSLFENERLAPWLMDFNPQTGEFLRKGRRDVIKIHDPIQQKIAQDFEELISNVTA